MDNAYKKKYDFAYSHPSNPYSRRKYVDRELTDKQVLFCEHYLISGGNARAACKAAGYNVDNSSAVAKRILSNKYAKKYIKVKKNSVERKLVLYEEKVKKLWKIAELAVPDSSDSLDGANPAAAISAIAELNKMSGDYAPTKTLNVDVTVDTDIIKARELAKKLQLINSDNNCSTIAELEHVELEQIEE